MRSIVIVTILMLVMISSVILNHKVEHSDNLDVSDDIECDFKS